MNKSKHHVCPWWMGYFLASPLRRLYQNPEKIVGPFLNGGMRILEIGPGMGFFTLPMARMVGEKGKIYCVDLQQRMLYTLRRRAKKAGLSDRIEDRLCTDISFGTNDLKGSIDLVVAISVVHEVPNRRILFREMHTCLKENGEMLIAEPQKRVSANEFGATLSIAAEMGLTPAGTPQIRGFRSALLVVKTLKTTLSKKGTGV
jgi:ubiquinone/menaquinone biosynthesis C-methylase UbiE